MLRLNNSELYVLRREKKRDVKKFSNRGVPLIKPNDTKPMFGLFVQVKGDEDRFYVVGTRLCTSSRLEKAVLTGPDQDGPPPGTGA